MKLFSWTVVLLFCSQGLAQMTLNMPAPRSDIASEGFRISAFKPNYKTKLELAEYVDVSGRGYMQDSSVEGESKNGFGVSLGYVSLPANSIGWLGNVSYIDLSDASNSAGIYRLDMNLAFTLSRLITLKAGANMSKITVKQSSTSSVGDDVIDSINALSPGFGYQSGIGIQLNKSVGIEITQTFMKQAGTQRLRDISIKHDGTEIGMNGTF